MKKHIYIIRHGETDLNRQHIVQGSGIDSTLNDLGHQQAKAFFDFYQHIPFDLVITSALQRTHQTVKPFLSQGIPWEQTPAINEINWGVHEGQKSNPFMVGNYKKLIDQWGAGNFDARLENGESAHEMLQRLQDFVNQLKKRHEKHILVCSHGRALRCLMCVITGKHLREMENYAHSNTGLYKMTYRQDHFLIDLENDIRHLEASAINSL